MAMKLTRRTFFSHTAGALGALATAGSLPSRARAQPSNRPHRVVIVLANEIQHPTLNFPLGFWAAELTHPYAELAAHGCEITIASPEGGRVTVDAYSDPRDPSGYSAHDFISLGFLESSRHAALLDTTTSLSAIRNDDFDAIIVAGGQSPMFTFRENEVLQGLIRESYEAGKPTAALCHGVASLIDVRLSNGAYLIAGKRVTGFSAAEDAFVDQAIGAKLFDWWVEPAMRERGADYVENGLWANFSVADGNLITGQQQNSGGAVARMVLDQLNA